MKTKLLLPILVLSLIPAGYAVAKDKKNKKAKPAPLEDLKLVEGDERGNEVKSLKAELMVSNAEEKAVDQAVKLIKKHKGTELEPDLQFRLAELYMRRAKTDRFFEVHRQSETVVKLTPRLVKEASSRSSLLKAVNTYGEIQARFPGFRQMDLVVFNHAFARQVLGQDKEAETLYWELITKHGRSPLVPEAHLAVGEIAFGRSEFSVALEHFNSIRKYPNSRVYPYGLYKAAWTYYNMRDAAQGLKKLEEVVAYGKYVAQGNTESRLDLRKEALNDMTLFFEDVLPSKDAYKYFLEQAGEKEVAPILLKMATLYERHSRFNDQRVVLDRFVQELPNSDLLPKINTDLVLAYDHLRLKDQAVSRLEAFAGLCSPDSAWVKAPNSRENCVTALNETSLRLAKKWLSAWKKTPKDLTFADASEKAFGIYLRTPAVSEEYQQSKFAYAELLFARGKFRDASTEYAALSALGPKGQLLHDANYGALLSLEKAVGEKWNGDDEKNFHALATEYLTKNPKGQYRLDIEYKMALLAYEKERYDEAAPIFLRLGHDFARQEKGQKAQDLYLDILNIKKDYRGIRDYASTLMKNSPNQGREQKMRKLYEQAYFLEVQSSEEKGRLKEALAEYLAFAKQNPTSELTEKAVWNALQLQYKLGDLLNGAKTAETFAGQFPKSNQVTNALLMAAQTFEQMGQLPDAARVLEKLSVTDPKAARRWNELAADFYALSGGTGSARRIYQDLKQGSDEKQKLALMNKLETLEKNYGTAETQAEIQKLLIAQNVQPQANQARVAQVEALFTKGAMTEAFEAARKVMGPSSGMTNPQRARLRMVQAKVLEAEFLKASVKARAERVAQVLSIKTEKLEKAQEAFQGAIKFGEPRVSVDAFEHLYTCYASYVKALKEMPIPAGLTADDAKAFRAELDRLVIPLEEKSIDTLAQAVQFAQKQQFLDGTAVRLQTRLDELNKQVNTNVAPAVVKPEPVLPLLAGVGP